MSRSLLFIVILLSLLLSVLGMTTSIRNYEVLVIGSLNVDFVTYTSRMPLVGETMYGKGFQKSYGGKGANQAVQAALLGAKTIMRGVIGGDTFGSDYISHLISVGVDTDHIAVGSRHTTGVATITVDDAGQNSIIIVPGANEDFTDSIIEENNSLIKSSNVLVCQNEIPVQATKAALISARQHGTVTILNPAPASTELISLVPYCDILCPNEVELAMLSGLEVKSEQEITAAAMKLLSGGCKVVLVTLGEKGACLVRKSGTIFFPTKAVNAVDTVGAGDSFIGALACNLSRGATLEESIRNALTCASESVTRKGAQTSYSSLSQLDENYRPPSLTENKLFSIEDILDNISE